jgi:hypothetical protein
VGGGAHPTPRVSAANDPEKLETVDNMFGNDSKICCINTGKQKILARLVTRGWRALRGDVCRPTVEEERA